MIINYNFDGNYYDYEVKGFYKAVSKILLDKSKEALADIIMCANLSVIDLKELLEEELKEYYEEYAYKEYKERRYE